MEPRGWRGCAEQRAKHGCTIVLDMNFERYAEDNTYTGWRRQTGATQDLGMRPGRLCSEGWIWDHLPAQWRGTMKQGESSYLVVMDMNTEWYTVGDVYAGRRSWTGMEQALGIRPGSP